MEGSVPYANFRAWVPKNVLPVGTLAPKDWVYYDWGPKSYPEPLLCLHPVVGSAESFFHQVIGLAERGYRVISVQLPVYWTIAEFCDGLHIFLDMLRIRRVHIYGAGLGGFLAMHCSSRRPLRVASIILTHSFLSTESVSHNVIYSPGVLRWLPDVLVRNAVKSLFPKGRAGLRIAEAAEFAIMHTLKASRDALASRLALLVTRSSVIGRIRIPAPRVSVINVNSAPSRSLDELKQALPGARFALIKSGGELPYLGAPDDVIMHLVVHMRRHAASPMTPLPLPPQARPRPVWYTHRMDDASETADNRDSANQDSSEKRKASFEAQARAIVLEEEDERALRYAFQLLQARKYITDQPDNFLLAVLADCGGNVDRTVQGIRDGKYKNSFPDKARRKAIRATATELAAKAVQEDTSKRQLVVGPGESRQDANQDANQDARSALPGITGDAGALHQNCLDSPKLPARKQGNNEARDSSGTVMSENVTELVTDVIQSCARNADSSLEGNEFQGLSVLGDTTCSENAENGVSLRSGCPHGVHENRLISDREEEDIRPATPSSEKELKLSSRTSTVPKVALTSQDAKADAKEWSSALVSGLQAVSSNIVSRKSPPKAETTICPPTSQVKKRSRYPPETDPMTAYVTSAKVGMRAHEDLVGRGPVPFPGRRPVRTTSSQKMVADSGGVDAGTSSSLQGQGARAESLKRDRAQQQHGETSNTISSEPEKMNHIVIAPGVTIPDLESLEADDTLALLDPDEDESNSSLQDDDGDENEHGAESNDHLENDGWGMFRGNQEMQSECNSSNAAASAESDDGREASGDEDARLREWMMSAQTATEYVRRR